MFFYQSQDFVTQKYEWEIPHYWTSLQVLYIIYMVFKNSQIS